MSKPRPPSTPVRAFLRIYWAPLVPVGLAAGYLAWRAWRIQGEDPTLDIHTHVTILVALAAAVIVLWNRAARGDVVPRLITELRLVHRQVAGLTHQVAAGNLSNQLVQGQLEQITGRLDAVTKRVDELHSDAYADGLAARQLRDPKGDPTDSLKPQVGGVWLSRGN